MSFPTKVFPSFFQTPDWQLEIKASCVTGRCSTFTAITYSLHVPIVLAVICAIWENIAAAGVIFDINVVLCHSAEIVVTYVILNPSACGIGVLPNGQRVYWFTPHLGLANNYLITENEYAAVHGLVIWPLDVLAAMQIFTE